MKAIYILIINLLSILTLAQSPIDYVILRPKSDSLKPDTVYGVVELPKNGVFWNVKINTDSGQKKFKTSEVIALQADSLYFGSIPYGTSYAIVPRLLKGKLELYFYYVGDDRISFLREGYIPFADKKEWDPDSSIYYDDLYVADPRHAALWDLVILLWEVPEYIWERMSRYYIYDPRTDKYYKVPRGNRKFKRKIAPLFKDHQEIHSQILNEDLDPEEILLIVSQYNRDFENQR